MSADAVSAEHLASADTQLRGPWLSFARVAWIVAVLFIVGFFIASLPGFQAQLEVTCAPIACSFWQLTPAAAQALASSGISIAAYASYTLILIVLFGSVWLAVALVIFWRKSDDWMAMLVALMLVVLGTAELTEVVEGTPSFWQVPAIILNEGAYFLLFLVFCLFPNGRFVPRWIRWFVLGSLANAVVHGIVVFRQTAPHQDQTRYPFVLNLIFFAFQVGLVAAQLYRYRRVSTPLERQQTKWVVFALAIGIPIGAGLIGPALFFPALNPLYILLAESISTLLALVIPVPVAIAILRYRLFDIDIIIRRTLVYGSLTGILAAVYFACVIAAQVIAQAVTGVASLPPIAIVASTLLIAALFNPLRRVIQRFIDRRFYRRKYDAAKTVAAFSAALRSEVNLDQLRAHLVNVVRETMQPTHVSLWLREPASSRLAAQEAPWQGGAL